MSQVRTPLKGYLFYLLAASMWSVNGTVSKTLLATGIDATRLSQLRVTAAFIIMVIVVLLTRRDAFKIRSREEFKLLLLYGVLGVTMTQWLYFIAIELLPVGIALVIEFTAPLMVAMWVKLVWDHHIPKLTWIGLAIAITGLVLVTEVWSGFQLNALGVLSAAGAAAALAIYFLVGEKILHQDNPRDTVSMTMWGFGFASLFWALWQPWWSFPWDFLQGEGQLAEFTFSYASMSIWMIVMGTAVPFWLVLEAIKHLSAQQASATGMTEPILASIVAWIILGEVLSGWQILGGLVTLSGILLAEYARK
jgi:drug/metabolite transporter (DMT)-like permease